MGNVVERVPDHASLSVEEGDITGILGKELLW
jgi:hypothetical protein